MAPWFYHPHELHPADHVRLDLDEARHATGARRLRDGQAVCLFDGCGALAIGRIAAVADRGRDVEVAIDTIQHAERAAPILHLACALPKGDRQAVLLDMATQLGVASFTPMLCEHSIVKPSPQAAGRWRRICIEACKQSRHAYLPQIRAAVTPAEYVRAAEHPVWLAHVGGPPPASLLASSEAMPSPVAVLIGPEGGFSASEVAAAEAAGARTVGLGAGILRIETAAVSLLAFLRLTRWE